MPRQSITLSEPNDQWLKAQIASNEYSSKSELVNDLIRQARKQQQLETIRLKLLRAEQSGFTAQTQAEILAEAKSKVNG